MRKFFALLTCLAIMPGLALAAANPVQQHVPNANRVGQGTLTYLFWDVYRATLYAPSGSWKEGEPLALTLHYLRDFSGTSIADRSIKEMRQLGWEDEVKLAAWHKQMKQIFPDVKEGEDLTGILTPDGVTKFYQSGQLLGTVQDPKFGDAFFDIWLDQGTSAPELRRALLGMK